MHFPSSQRLPQRQWRIKWTAIFFHYYHFCTALLEHGAQSDILSLHDRHCQLVLLTCATRQLMIEKGALRDIKDDWVHPDASLSQMPIEMGVVVYSII